MKKIILFFSIISLFSCKQNSLNTNQNKNLNKQTSERDSKTDTNIQDYKKQIMAGESLGTIILNENATPVLDSLGQPTSADAAMGKAVFIWHKESNNYLSIYTTTQMGVEDFSRIKAIRTLSADFKTEKNLGVNSTLSEIEKDFELIKIGVFPFKNKSYTLYSSHKGIGFEIGEDQKCHGLVLTEKGTSPEQLYLTFYPGLKKV